MRKPKSIRQKLLSAAPPAEGAAGAPIFRITSPALDRHRDRVLAMKADGEEVRVPLLWEHNSWTPAIGFGRCYREGDAWVMAPVFDEVDELSKTVSGKVKAGSLFTCSIGFVPVEEPVPNAEGGFDYPLVELLEVSIVNVPANPDAVRLRSVGAGGRHPGFASALKALAASQAAVLAVLKSEGDALEDDEEEADKNVGDEGAATGELTPKAFAEGLLAHLQAGAQLAADFLEAGLEDEVLVPLAEAVGTNLAADVATLQDWLAGGDAQAASEEEPEDDDTDEEAKDEDAEDDEEDDALPDEEAASETPEDEPDEEEAKRLRLHVRKHFGFTAQQAAALSGSELRRYSALAA
ncbi:primosomal replication protein N [Corallococcus sp. CA047B]|uniref:HK97 family phage prohead protease n=1 Tax=Corallococcus sp. CA047B TaxID=2316729 RepID=UPI000EA3675A|nr:HK97 family phage prohead protease [Corallococcus sp. CA047B]RKH08729.1 primosomal replication protein N [Corallococcus sp. CA047B]